MITLTHENVNEFVNLNIHCDKKSEQIADELVAALQAHGWDVGDVGPSKLEGHTCHFYLLKFLTELKKAG